MQEQMAKTQAELEDKTVEVQAAGGKITVIANGSGDVISIKIAREIVDPEDVEFLEEALGHSFAGFEPTIGSQVAAHDETSKHGYPGCTGLGRRLASAYRGRTAPYRSADTD